MWIRIPEPNLNVTLAELLAESGLRAIGEVRVKSKQPDVLLDVSGIRIIIEGKYPGKRKELQEEATRRIDEGLCDIVMMVEYAKLNFSNLEITQRDIKQILRGASYNVGFVTYIERIGLEKWFPELKREIKFYEGVKFRDIVDYLMSVYDYVVKENVLDRVIERLREGIFSFADNIKVANININRLRYVLEWRED
ncbi:MAG: hypothetical protein DRN92_06730 [Thermoproteota archaeon]|nr:MAG: hypothetical protein DRN92_06730 [Candidatus Korarchaeota archaeon]